MNPLSSASPLSPLNPANPASPLNPINISPDPIGEAILWFLMGMCFVCLIGILALCFKILRDEWRYWRKRR